jgi:hypothetical protein
LSPKLATKETGCLASMNFIIKKDDKLTNSDKDLSVDRYKNAEENNKQLLESWDKSYPPELAPGENLVPTNMKMFFEEAGIFTDPDEKDLWDWTFNNGPKPNYIKEE